MKTLFAFLAVVLAYIAIVLYSIKSAINEIENYKEDDIDY